MFIHLYFVNMGSEVRGKEKKSRKKKMEMYPIFKR